MESNKCTVFVDKKLNVSINFLNKRDLFIIIFDQEMTCYASN